MFLHSFKYTFISLIRDKNTIMWCLLFPVILAIMFKFAFGNLSEAEQFQSISVALVETNADNKSNLESFDMTDMLESLSQDGSEAFLDITYASEQEALDLLERKEIYGILYADYSSLKQPLTLTLSAEMKEDPFYQSILSVLVENFNAAFQTVFEVVKEHPEKVPEVLESLQMETSYLKAGELGMGDLDEMLNYFFNLLSMTCLYGAVTGFTISTRNQANLTDTARRKSIAPTDPLRCMHGDLMAGVCIEYGCALFALGFCKFILQVNFGGQVGYVLLAGLVGTLVGVSFGFMMGCIGKMTKEQKTGIMFGIIMVMCMLSGLMYGSMRMEIEKVAPLINKINPSALISDSFYALIVYPSHERFWQNIVCLLVESVIFYVVGVLFIRRKKYASL